MILKSKVALVTGGSQGIGAAIARKFAIEGASLALVSRGEELTGLASSLKLPEDRLLVVNGDVGKDEDMKSLILSIRRKFRRLDVLVNNAGVMHPGKIGMSSMAEVREMLNVNLAAPINLSQLAVRIMGSDGGSIINIASIAGTQGLDGLSAYSACKAGLVGFTRAAAKELASRNIRVNAVAPGFIETPMARIGDDNDYSRRLGSVRMGRIGTGEDVAHAVVYLASDSSAYVTGQVIGVDGSMQA